VSLESRGGGLGVSKYGRIMGKWDKGREWGRERRARMGRIRHPDSSSRTTPVGVFCFFIFTVKLK